MSCDTINGCVLEDSAFVLLSRFEIDGANATQADVSSITWSAFDVTDQDTVHASGTLSVSSVVFDTLQTDGRWTEDSTGYNFLHELPATTFTTSGNRYRIEHKVTTSGGGSFYLTPFEVNVKAIWSS